MAAAIRSNPRVALNSMAIPNDTTIKIINPTGNIDSNLGAPYSLPYPTYQFQVKNKGYLKFKNNITEGTLRLINNLLVLV